MRIKLIKNKKTIGHLVLHGDLNGGGLNGGVFFVPIDNKNILNKDIPLFEEFKFIL